MDLVAAKRFPYRAFPIRASAPYPNGSIAYRPIITASIDGGTGRTANFDVLLDSGADSCTFPLSLAPLLGLDLLRMPKVNTAGVGSQANMTYYSPVIVQLGDDFRFDVYAGFTQGLDAVGLGLLGQRDFFEACNVEFRLSERTFSIEKS